MTSYKTILKEKDNQNWLKSSLALRITRSGLRGLSEGVSSRTQRNILTSIQQTNTLNPGTKCSQCQIENLFQCPTRGLCSKPKDCKFHDTPNKMQRPCLLNICGDFKNEIIKVHRYSKPFWKNTRAEMWCANHWEVAKCFMGEGYHDVKSFDDTDFNGVINLMLNCKEYEGDFSFSVDNVPNLLTEARDVGRKVRHSPDLKVSDAELAQYFTTLTALLVDPKYLAGDTNAQEALQKLHQLNSDMLHLSTKDVDEVLQEARVVVETGILKLEQTVGDSMKKIINQTKQSVSQVADKSIVCQREIYSRTNEALQALDKVVEEATCKLKAVPLSSSAEQEEDFRQRLAKCYLKTLHTAQISPLVSERDELLERFYVSPKIVEKNHRRVQTTEEDKEPKQVTSYRQVLCIVDKFVGRVIIEGEAGMGKSTFTAKIALDWSKRWTLPKTKLELSVNIENKLFQDVETLENIEFLFHVTLRDAGRMCSLTQMIKDQLIHRLYEPDETVEACKMAKRVLFNRKCVIIADGLDEWTHPFDLDCSCKDKDKVVPFLSPHIDATVLITTRPWRMAHQPIGDSGIDKLLGIEGTADTEHLVQNVLQCLDGKLDQKANTRQFMSSVFTKHMVNLMSIPIIVMMLVCLWFHGEEKSYSLCAIYAQMVAMMFKRTENIDSICQGKGIRLPRCFPVVMKFSNLLEKLAHFAFSKLYVSDRRESLVFRDVEELTREELVCLLKTGVIREKTTLSLVKNLSSYYIIHKTVQEFLASLHVYIHPHAFYRVVKPNYDKKQDITDFENVFIFVCGMNCDAAHRISELLCVNLACTSYERAGNYTYQVDIPYIVTVSKLQKIIIAGQKEACKNGIKDISLALYDFSIKNRVEYVSNLKTLLSMNKSKVRSINVSNSEEFLNEKELQEVFHLSSNSLIGVTLSFCRGRYDLSACSRLKYLNIIGPGISDIKVNTDSLVSCILCCSSSKIQNEVIQSLRKSSKQLKHLKIDAEFHIDNFLQALPLLTKLEYVFIGRAEFNERRILLLGSVTHIELSYATMAAMTFQRLVDCMESSKHTVKCWLSNCSVVPYNKCESMKKYIRSRKDFRIIKNTNDWSKPLQTLLTNFEFYTVKE